MASTLSRTKCSGLYLSSSSNLARSSSGFSCGSTAFGNPSSPVTPAKLRGQSFRSASSQNGNSLVYNPRNSAGHSISVKNSVNNGACSNQKKYCMCSPSTHPGAFRCSLHRNVKKSRDDQQLRDQPSFYRSTDLSLNLRRMSLANSLLKIGVAEGRKLLRKASSPPQQKIQGAAFQPRPSRLSRMSMGRRLMNSG